MLINLTNHPFERWDDKQMQCAIYCFGTVHDYPFPVVDPSWDEKIIREQAVTIVCDVINKYGDEDIVVHLMGEFTMCYALITLFKAKGITCVASTTNRIVIEDADGTKTSKFEFFRFRKY